jgi:putative GTP pyrophosphokinase
MKQKSQQPFNAGEISDQYKNCKDNYNKLGINLVQALELFLKEQDIKVLSIDYRVKADSSFAEKIDRKHYENPFDEIEDICGIRIICYYQSDVEKISEVLRQEFSVIENQDKETLLKADQFGYRSTHFIVKIKEEWNKAPNYRGLENLKAEIQIRTVLMHAWAEIEHKLVYKNENQVPSQFRRKLSRISAKLEEADEQFEELRKEATNYKKEVTGKFEKDEYKGVELNLDSLQAFLDKYFPDRLKNLEFTSYLLKRMGRFNISLNELFISYQKTKQYLLKFETDAFNDVNTLEQTGIADIIICLTNPDYLRFHMTPVWLHEIITSYRKIIAADEAAKNSKE